MDDRAWSQEEDIHLNKLYNEDTLSIMDISNVIKRTPGTIISRLLKLQYIVSRSSVRGYKTYKESDLYKEIVSANKDKKEKVDKKKREGRDNKREGVVDNNNNNSITELKKDVQEIKESLKELLTMMKAVYDFENNDNDNDSANH
uniref:Uncharacterized protein n=1 Tax=viral metagenome TaxID=1070528 RepID=A0A6C0I4L8_9ZZZZ